VIFQILIGLTLVAGCALVQTALLLQDKSELVHGLYLWPLYLWSAIRDGDSTQRVILIPLWLLLGGALRLVWWDWPWYVFSLASIALPVVWIPVIAVGFGFYEAILLLVTILKNFILPHRA
jgi:hypothetical protein